MRNIVNTYVDRFRHERKTQIRFATILLVLALAVVGIVFWQLHNTGVAMANDTYCGLEEHTHSEDCYETVLTCGLEEGETAHTHDESCLTAVTTLTCDLEESEGHSHSDSCYDADGNLICGLEESAGHTHSDACYTTQNVVTCGQEEGDPHEHTESCYEDVLICDIPEHEHSILCMSDETADVETAKDWEATLPDEISDNWAEAVIEIAQSQLGYTESTANFEYDEESESQKGYTRYGAWYGIPYGDWCAMFVSFCLNYAEIPEETFPEAAGCYAWVTELQKMEAEDPTGGLQLYADAEDYTPVPGDIIFFDLDEKPDGKADHVGIVEEVITKTVNGEEVVTKVKTIEGNSNDKVQERTYKIDDETILGYGILPENPDEEEAPEDVDDVDVESELPTEEINETEEAEELALDADSLTYTAEDGGVVVTVSVPKNALPDGAELVVTMFDEDSGEYAEAAEVIGIDTSIQTLSADGGVIGMAAMDISFLVDGEEVEPSETVSVAIDATAILPDDVNAMAAWHLEEIDDGIDSEQVASGDGSDKVVEFETEGFSTFTVTWHAGGYTSSSAITVTSYFDNVQNNDLGPSDLAIGYENEFIFDDSNGLLAVDGYEIDHAEIVILRSGTYNCYSIQAVFDWGSTWTYYYKTSATATKTSVTYSNISGINLYYKTSSSDTENTGDLHISGDAISTTGSLVATYDKKDELDDFADNYYFRWYRLKTEYEDDENIDVEDYSEWDEMIGWTGDTLPIYSEAARHTYHVELYRISDNEVIARSNPYLVPYYNDVQNGSFEDVNNNGTLTMQYTDNLYTNMVWRTTGFGSLSNDSFSGQDIEIVQPDAAPSSAVSSYGYGKNSISASDGDQFAELNCEYDGTLYQDVLTTPNETMTWSLDHMARNANFFNPTITSGNAVDTMCVIVMDAATADAEFTGPYANSQEALIQSLIAASGLANPSANNMTDSSTFNYTFSDGTTSSVTMWLISSDDTNWHSYSASFTVPEGQYLSRFLFGAVSTASGDNTMGNLLDNIHLSSVALDADGLLTITKEVEGVSASEVIPSGTFTFTILETGSGNKITTVSLPIRDAYISDTEAWTVAIDVSTLGHDDLTIVETDPNNIGSYQYTGETTWTVVHTSTSGNSDQMQSNTSGVDYSTGAVLVSNNTNTAVTFTNTYQEYITIEKVASGNLASTIDGAEFQIEDSNGNALSFVKSIEEVTDKSGDVTGTRTIYTLATEKDIDTVDTFTIGSADFVGLEENTEYTLTEITAPGGYDGLSDPIVFKIVSGQILIKSEDGEFVTQSGSAGEAYNNTLTLLIQNSKRLPNTGGIGTTWYTIGGLALILGAGICLKYKYSRRRKEVVS